MLLTSSAFSNIDGGNMLPSVVSMAAGKFNEANVLKQTN